MANAFLETFFTKSERLFAFFLPESLQEGSDAYRRAKLVVVFSLVLASCGSLYGLAFLAIGMPASAAVCMAAAVTIPGALYVLKAKENLTFAGHWVSAVVGFALVAVTLFTGGIHSPAMTWMAVVPMAALMLAGSRGGVAWALFSGGAMALYFGVELTSRTPASEITGLWLPIFRAAFSVGLIGAIAGLSYLYESNKNQMLGHIEKARDAANEAHEEARIVLDNIQDALLTFNMDGQRFGASSKAAEVLFQAPKDAYLWDLFKSEGSDAAE